MHAHAHLRELKGIKSTKENLEEAINGESYELTFHMASILYIDRLSPPDAKNLGQAVNNALTYGLGLMADFFINGALYGITGSFWLFRLSSLIALAGGAMLAVFHLLERPCSDA